MKIKALEHRDPEELAYDATMKQTVKELEPFMDTIIEVAKEYHKEKEVIIVKKIKTLEHRDPEELFDEWGYCKICDYEIINPRIEDYNTSMETYEIDLRQYRHAIEYHFKLHLKREEIKTIERDVVEG